MKSPEEYYIQLKKKTHINVMLKRVPTLNMSLYETKQRTVDQLDTIKKSVKRSQPTLEHPTPLKSDLAIPE